MFKIQNSLKKLVSLRNFAIVMVAIVSSVLLYGKALGRFSEPGRFLRMDFVPGIKSSNSVARHGKFLMSFDGKVKAEVSREKAIPLFFVDILGGKIDTSPFLMNFPGGPAKMVRLNQVSVEPPVIRATFFLRKPLTPRVRYLESSLEVSFKDPDNESNQNRSYTLIPPDKVKKNHSNRFDPKSVSDEKSGEPLNISVKNADPRNLFIELTRQMGKSVHFRDIIPNNVELDINAAAPMEALMQIAEKLELAITEEDGDIWISKTENPLLKLPDSDMVEGVDLSKLALGDVLRALGQIAEFNIVLDDSLLESKDKPVQMYLQKMTIRRAFETILKVNNLVFKPVDNKTMIIMTAQRSREMAGKVVRVISSEVPIETLKAFAKEVIPEALSKRLVVQEDLGNLVLIGDKEAVDLVQTTIQSIGKKLKTAGEGTSRAIFHPVNTKPEELITLITESLGKTENVKIVPDKRTDRLVIHGSESSINRVLRLLKELDRPVTKQALIKIRLIEIHRKDLAELGITFPNTLAQTSDIGDLTKAQAIIPATFTGFKENSKAKTLANPTLRCMDKEEATIDISEQIPVKNTTTEYLPVASSSLAARSSENWTTTDIGIKLSVQPFIHKDNEITMNVDIDLTELVQFVEGHPWTAKRLIKTKVRVKNNETVVIGGLIRSKKDKTKRPVPLLNRIPFLRRLFRPVEHNSDSDESTEMVVLITPSVVGTEGITISDKSTEFVNTKR